MTSVREDIDTLLKESQDKAAEASQLNRLLEEYSDLEPITIYKYGKVYCSASVNSKADKLVIRHSCGCCNDAPLLVMPYLDTPNGKVYSNPPKFEVGEMNGVYYADVPKKGWKDNLKASNIPDAIIEKVAEYFKKQAE